MKKRPVVPHPTDPTLALVELTRGKWAVIDAADSIAVDQFVWFAVPGYGACWYAVSATGVGGGPKRRLHRFIAERMGIDVSDEIDHRNGNGIDCRRSNLRAATGTTNSYNRKIRCDNLTGAKGVTFYRDGRRLPWSARCSQDGHRVARYFETKEEAIAAAGEMRREFHGDFARHN
jgi:hypothetical protein